MNNVQLQDVQAPDFLSDYPMWLVWKSEQYAGDKKPRKVPYYVGGVRRHGIQGSPADVSKLAYFDIAKQYALDKGYTGVGIAMLGDFSVVDFDACVVDGVILSEICSTFSNGTYAEYSPSGSGVHVYVEGNLGDRKDTAKDGNWGIELFNEKGFLTFTGNPIEGAEPVLRGCDLPLAELIHSRLPRRKEFIPLNTMPDTLGMSIATLAKVLEKVDADCDYHLWVRAGMSLHYETDGSEEGFQIWDAWSATGTKYTSVEFNRAKWDSFGNNNGGPPVTGRSLIKLSGYAEPVHFEPITTPLNGDQPVNSTGSFTDLSHKIDGHTAPYFKAVSFKERRTQRNATKWLIEDFLPAGELGIMYGAPGSGKSFVALDMCLNLARGCDWMGMECSKERNKVLYIVAEGNGNFTDRLDAYCIKEGLEDPEIDISFMSDTPLNITKVGNADKFIADAKFNEGVDLIVVDTFARVTPGINESDSADMGLAIEYCRKIHKAYNTMVLLIHHSGKDSSRGMRGHSSMNGAADVVMSIAGESGAGTISIEKQKDGEIKESIGFKLTKVSTGVAPRSDKDISLGRPGKILSSCDAKKMKPAAGAPIIASGSAAPLPAHCAIA